MTTRWLIRCCSLHRRELLAQIDLSGLGVVGQLGGGAGGEDPPVVEDVGAVGDGERLPDVVVGDQHADAALLQPGHDLLDVPDRDRIDAGEGLVEQEVAGTGHERPRDLEPPPLTARQGVGLVLGEPGQVELGEQLPEPRHPLLMREVERLQDREQVLLDGELAEHRGLLRQVAHAETAALVHRQLGHVLALQEDAPAVGAQEAHDHVERGGLARAVGPEEADHLPRVDVEAHAVHHHAAPKPLAQPLGDQTFHERLMSIGPPPASREASRPGPWGRRPPSRAPAARPPRRCGPPRGRS